MAKGTGEAVWYNDGTEERCLALVLEDRGSVADLIVFDPVGGVTWHGIV